MKPDTRLYRMIPLVLGLLALSLAPQAAVADDSSGTTTISKQTLVELLQQIQSLQSEVRDLRNKVEVQGHDQDQFRSRMQDLTQDLDRRVRALERVGGAPAAAGPQSQPSASAGGQSSAPAAAPAGKAPAGKEQSAYDAAFQLMKQGDYGNAGNAFRAFIKKYPSSALAPNAQYWIGESNYIQRNFPSALKEFIKVQENYPGSRKVPDAILKIGYTYYELHEWDKARAFLNEVAKRYPGTLLARSARTRLDMMQKQGH
jgi:tol-pal system protein YbgF